MLFIKKYKDGYENKNVQNKLIHMRNRQIACEIIYTL